MQLAKIYKKLRLEAFQAITINEDDSLATLGRVLRHALCTYAEAKEALSTLGEDEYWLTLKVLSLELLQELSLHLTNIFSSEELSNAKLVTVADLCKQCYDILSKELDSKQYQFAVTVEELEALLK